MATGYDAIIDHIANGDPEATAAACQQALAGGASAQDIVTRGLSKGMRKIARDLNKKGMYLDTMLGSSFAFNAGYEALRPQLERERGAPEGTVVLGVMDGPWTIGTGIVSAVLQANNLRVVDAGSDVTPERVIAAAVEAKADVVAVGMYLSYKLDLVRRLADGLAAAGLRHKVRLILSGPAGSPRIAETYGADVYSPDAEAVLTECREFLASKKGEMTSRQRVLASLKLQEPDRVPLVAFSMTFTAKHAGVKFSDYVSRAEVMAEAEIKACRRFGWDDVCNSSDVGLFAQAIGGEVFMPEDDIPRIVQPVLSVDHPREDFERIRQRPVEEYIRNGRLAELIQSVRYMRQGVGDEVAVIGWIEGAFQGTMLLFGADPRAWLVMRSDPGLTFEIFTWYNEYAFAAAKAMIDNGADIIGCGESGAYFLSPDLFQMAAFPFEQPLFQRITEAGAKVLIHCCGNVPQCIGFAPDLNPGGAIQFDYQVNLAKAKKQIGDRITLMGNLDCNRVLHLGSKADVLRTCRRAIQDAGAGGGFWLSGGCEIPRDMPYENMDAMFESVNRYGRYPLPAPRPSVSA
jgi:uroporphyrinogen decarboxylase